MITTSKLKNLKKNDTIFVEGEHVKFIDYTEGKNYNSDIISYSSHNNEHWKYEIKACESNVCLSTDTVSIDIYFNSLVDKKTEEIANIATKIIPEIEIKRAYFKKYTSPEAIKAEKIKKILKAKNEKAIIKILKEKSEIQELV